MNKKNLTVIILLVLAFLCVIYNNKISSVFKPKSPETKPSIKTENNIEPTVEDDKNLIEIPINSPTELSYKLKENIYAERIYYVQHSIFRSSSYSPTDAIFGNIVSGKPWMANDICKDWQTKASKIDGPSEEARFINNPAILVAIEYPFSFSNFKDKSWCTDPTSTMMPQKVTYEKLKKEISVYYKRLPFETENNHSFYTFNGLNARDLGYKYAYIDPLKSTYDKLIFQNEPNMSNEIVRFENFIHLGSSCQVPGGCNNGSPRQPYLEFKQKNTNYTQKNGEIYIKLWRYKPSSPSKKADITERIIIQEY